MAELRENGGIDSLVQKPNAAIAECEDRSPSMIRPKAPHEVGLPAGSDARNIDVLRNIKSLKWVRVAEAGKPIPAADFWRRYDAGEFLKRPAGT